MPPDYNYDDALAKSFLFYEAQRSGILPSTNRISWRKDSALGDASAIYDANNNGLIDPGETLTRDLSGGYYDAGDNMKYAYPMASSMTLLSWGVAQYQAAYAFSGQLDEALATIRWGTDWLLKAHETSGNTGALETVRFWGQVGRSDTDHKSWVDDQRISTLRPAYYIDPTKPGSDMAAEAAATLASSSIIFRSTDAAYADRLLDNAKALFRFAYQYQGVYSNAIPDSASTYGSKNFNDDLAWGAVWLHKAIKASGGSVNDPLIWGNNQTYLQIAKSTNTSLTKWTQTWADKQYGTAVLLAQEDPSYDKTSLEKWLNYWTVKGATSVPYTTGGLAVINGWGSLRYSANTAFLAGIYSDTVQDYNGRYSDFSKTQIDYILGNNPRGSSYMVGFGNTYSRNVHHRSAQLNNNPAYTGTNGWSLFNNNVPNQNILYGALVGGPGSVNDFDYQDTVTDYRRNEVALDYNAGFTGVLARLYSKSLPPSLSNTVPVLNSIATGSLTDTAANDTFVDSAASLQGSDTDSSQTLTYGISGGNATNIMLSGIIYNVLCTSDYGILYLNSITGQYRFVANGTAINGLTANAAAVFTFTLSDGLASVTQRYTINITGTNDVPTLQSILGNYIDTSVADAFTTLSGTLVGGDREPGTVLTYGLLTAEGTALIPNGSGFVSLTGTYGTLQINSSTGAYLYTPNNAAINGLSAGSNLSDGFIIAVADGGLTATSSFTINITAANDAPTGNASATLAASIESTDYTITEASLLQGFSDAEGDLLAISGLTATNGTIVANGNGTYTFTPVAGINGTITLSYNVVDRNGGTTAATQFFSIKATPTIASVTPDNIINYAEEIAGITVSGTAEANSTIQLLWGSTTVRTTADTAGQWSRSFTSAEIPADGNTTIIAIATDAAGNSSAAGTRSLLIDTVAPTSPTIASVTPDNIINYAEEIAGISVSGTAEANSTIQLLWGSTTVTTTADTSGQWSRSFTSAEIPADGNTTITAIATDAAGNSSAAGTRSLLIDTVAPTPPTIGTLATHNIINAAEATAGVVLTGSTESGSGIGLIIGTATRNAVVDGTTWRYTLSSADMTVLAQGTGKTVTVVATDAAGNTSSTLSQAFAVDTLAPTTPTLNLIGGADSIVNSTADDATITGSAEAGSGVTLKFGNTVLGGAITNTSGGWSYTLTSENITAIGQGSSKTLTAAATDAAGNVSDVTAQMFAVDTIALAAPSITTITDNVGSLQAAVATGASTDDTTPTIVISLVGVNAIVGNTLLLFNGSTQIASLALTSTHLSAGSVSITPAALAPGNYSITASVTSVGGNPGIVSTPRTFTIDTTLPAAPVLNAIAGDNRVNSTEKSAGVTVSGTAEANSTVSITWGSTTMATFVDANGTWSRTFTAAQIPTDGTTTLTVGTTDAAGNTSLAATASILIDTNAPTATVTAISTLSNDTGSSVRDFITNTISQTVAGTFMGTVGTGESIQVSANGGTTWQTATINTASRTWSAASVTLQPGTTSLITRTVDAAGNAIAGVAKAYTLDQTAPTVAVAIAALSNDAGSSTSDFITNAANQTVTGTFTEPLGSGELIQVSANGGTTWVTATIAGSNWTAAGLTLLKGTDQQIRTRIRDTAGNIASGGSKSYTLDTTAPQAPTVNSYTATSIIGTVEANASALLSTSVSSPIPSSFAASAIANPTGNYILDPSALAGSSTGTTYSLYSRDVAGNVSPTASSQRVVAGSIGSDTFINMGGTGSDLLIGRTGTDTVQYTVATGAIALTGQITSASGTLNVNTAKIDVLTGIETLNFTGTTYTGVGTSSSQVKSTIQTSLGNNSAAVLLGFYNTSTGTFSFGSSVGPVNATLLAFDTNTGTGTNYEAFLLLGKTTASGTISVNAGTVTLSGLA